MAKLWVRRTKGQRDWIVRTYLVDQTNQKPWFGGNCLFEMHYLTFRDYFGWIPSKGTTEKKDILLLSTSNI